MWQLENPFCPLIGTVLRAIGPSTVPTCSTSREYKSRSDIYYNDVSADCLWMFSERPYGLGFSSWFVYLLPSAILLVALRMHYLRSRPLPPGPPGLPFLGNIFQIPSRMAWVKFVEWSQEYGESFEESSLSLDHGFGTRSDILCQCCRPASNCPQHIQSCS